MNINSDEFDITKIKDKEIKTLLKQRDTQIKKTADFSNLADATRKTFYQENHKLYHDFLKAVEQLPLEYTNKEIKDAINKLKQLILMRQFLKPYRDKFIFSKINFLSTENDELDRYRRIILSNINGLTRQSLIDLETKLGIENFNEKYTQKQDRRLSRNSPRSPGREPVRSPDPSSIIEQVNGRGSNNRFADVSPISSGKKRKTAKGKRNKQQKRNSSRRRRSAKKKV